MAIKPLFIAVDTNVLIDQALGDANVYDALQVICERLPGSRLVVTQTVLEELGFEASGGDSEEEAVIALTSLRAWGYTPFPVIPVGAGIVQTIGFKLRVAGVVPEEEENDAMVIAEAALLNCSILLSSDKHLLEAQENPRMLEILRDCHVDGDQLIIGSPRTIASKYFRRK